MNIGSAFLRSDFSPIDRSHAGDCARIESDAINVRALCCVICDLGGLRIQAIDRRLLICSFRLQIINSCRVCRNIRLVCGNIPFVCRNIIFVCRRLRHGIIDFSQCGGHAQVIADCPSHLQRTCFHGSHIGQLRAVSIEIRSLLLQIGDVAIGSI